MIPQVIEGFTGKKQKNQSVSTDGKDNKKYR